MNLHIKSKIATIHNKMEILNDSDEVVYRVSSKAVSLHDTTVIQDAAGNDVASFHAKLLSIHHTYYIDMANGENFELSEELFHIKDIVDIPTLGWQLRGSVLAFEFEVVDANEQVLATAHRPVVSLHDIYDLNIIDESHVDELITLFVVISHIIQQRNMSESDDMSRVVNPQ